MEHLSQYMNSYSERFDRLKYENSTSEFAGLNQSFWDEIKEGQYPIIEKFATEDTHYQNHEIVTFLYQSSEDLTNVFILAEFNLIDPKDYVFEKIKNTDIYFKSFILPKNAQAEYRIFENDPLDGIFAGAKYANRFSRFDEHPDPLSRNIQRIRDGIEPGKDMLIAWLRMPTLYHGILFESENITLKGKLTNYIHSSEILNYSRKISIYTPPEYNVTLAYPYLILFDGSSFIKYAKSHLILDNMISEGKIEPIICIFVDPGMDNGQTKRYDEFPCNSKFAESITNEIIPWVQEKHSLNEDPKKNLIAGSSYGGLTSFYYSFMYPQVIGNVLSLSGSFHVGKNYDSDYDYEWLPQQIAFSEKKEIRSYLAVGMLEGEYSSDSPEFPNQIVSHRHFTTILKMRGYDFEYEEYNGDHSHPSWFPSFIKGLRHFLSVK